MRMIRAEVYQSKEKEPRESNIVIKGIDEIEDINKENYLLGIEKMRNDKHLVSHLIETVLEVNEVDITETKRVPAAKKEGDKHPWMIIAKLGNPCPKLQLLTSAKETW